MVIIFPNTVKTWITAVNLPGPCQSPQLHQGWEQHPCFSRAKLKTVSRTQVDFYLCSLRSDGKSSLLAQKTLLPQLAVSCIKPHLTICFKPVFQGRKHKHIPQNRDALNAPSSIFLPILSSAAATRHHQVITVIHWQELLGSKTPQESQLGPWLPPSRLQQLKSQP